MQKAFAGFLSVATALAVAACSETSTGAPRNSFMVCGQPLWNYQADSPVKLTYARPGHFHLPFPPAHSWPVLLKLTDDCASGVRISISHPDVLKIHAQARAKDGLVAGISILAKHRGQTTLTARRPSRTTTRIEIAVP